MCGTTLATIVPTTRGMLFWIVITRYCRPNTVCSEGEKLTRPESVGTFLNFSICAARAAPFVDPPARLTAVTIDNGDNAKDALDRITIPQNVLDRIAPTAVPKSSIIISDEPLSAETNYRTEFVAVLSNQPQGGFITRKPTPPADVMADGNSWDDGFGSLFQPWNTQVIDPRQRRDVYNPPAQQGYRIW